MTGNRTESIKHFLFWTKIIFKRTSLLYLLVCTIAKGVQQLFKILYFFFLSTMLDFTDIGRDKAGNINIMLMVSQFVSLTLTLD